MRSNKVTADNAQVELEELHKKYELLEQQYTELQKQKADSEIMLLSTLEATADAVWSIDFTKAAYDIENQSWYELLGYTKNELHQNSLSRDLSFVHPDDRKKVERAIEAHVSRQKPIYEVEFRIRKKNGDYMWVLSKGKIISRDENDSPVKMVGTFTDITERRNMEEKLWLYSHKLERMVEERTKELDAANKRLTAEMQQREGTERQLQFEHDRVKNYLHIAGVMMTVLNPDGSIAMINNKGCEILGLPEKDIINKNWFDHFIPESMRENLREVFTKSFSIGEDDLTSVGLYEYGNPILTVDGNIRHINWRNVLLRDIDGKIIGMLSSGLDVTEQREALQKMKESDERLREFGNTLDQLLWIVEDGKVIYSTSAMERVWGIKDTAGNFQVFMDMILPEDREFVTAIVRKHMNGIFSPSVFEYRFVHPLTGETRWLQTKAFKSDFPGKNRFIGLTQDITFKKKIEQELLNALEQSKQLNELKNNFISIVSHEIRTPLSVILTSAEYLRKFESDLSFEEKKKYYERIEIAVDQLSVLVENVKLLHKEQLKVEVHKAEEFNAVFLVEELIDAISIAHNRKINLNIQNNGDEILLYQDQNIVRYVYSNIITNAVKFSAQGIPVDVTLDRLDGFALLTVTDKGIGIPEGIEQKIFEPFWRAPNAGNIAGSGLGLTIASKFAQLIGGDITYASKAGEGTAFFVKIPLMQ